MFKMLVTGELQDPGSQGNLPGLSGFAFAFTDSNANANANV